ncbi:MAG: hypothetical protein KDJ75_10125 [Alphaproteobacteria bacterium]|nr:hypothetical protein [Alphaproteobacteria bacterium]
MNITENGYTEKGLCEQDLRYFTGSETWYRHSLFRKYLYTDGVQYVAEKGGAYWLIDKIFACQSCLAALAGQEFILWELTLNAEGQGATLSCTDGNCNPLYSEEIHVTDFPLKIIKFYFCNDTLLLPSEY